MSRKPTTSDAVEQLFLSNPDRVFTTEEVASHIYGGTDKQDCHSARNALYITRRDRPHLNIRRVRGGYTIDRSMYEQWQRTHAVELEGVRKAPTSKLESAITIINTPSPELRNTEAYHKLLAYLFTREGVLVRMWRTNRYYRAEVWKYGVHVRIVYRNSERTRPGQQVKYPRGWCTDYYYSERI